MNGYDLLNLHGRTSIHLLIESVHSIALSMTHASETWVQNKEAATHHDRTRGDVSPPSAIEVDLLWKGLKDGGQGWRNAGDMQESLHWSTSRADENLAEWPCEPPSRSG